MSKYLIIGNSAGGIAAVEAIREVDPQGNLVLVSDEPHPAYSRPAIAEFLMGERDLDERMFYRSKDFYLQNHVQEHLGVRVTNLDMEHHKAVLNTGAQLGYERLLIATGGIPIMPRMDGLGLKGVHAFTTIEHAQNIAQDLREGAKRVVVIGGGLIGCSLTNALVRRGGVEIVLVELLDRLLSTMMDTTASKMVEARLKELGVRVVTGHGVVRILPSASDPSRVGAVALDNGEEIACDLVGVAVGVAPRTELAKGTAIQVNRGIVVDRHMETTVPGIFACGDVAEAYDFIYDAPRVIAIWPNAYIGGRIAGFNMAGANRVYDGCTAMNSFSYFDLALASAGRFDPRADEPVEVIAKTRGATYKKAVLQNERLVGFLLMGQIEESGVLYNLMRQRVPVAEFKNRLLEDGFGVGFLPRSLRDAWLVKNGNWSRNGASKDLPWPSLKVQKAKSEGGEKS